MTRSIPHNFPTRTRAERFKGRLFPVYCAGHMYNQGKTVVCISDDIAFRGVPQYTLEQAEQVVDWLNGFDQPVTMVPEDKDPWMVRWERRVGVKHLLE